MKKKLLFICMMICGTLMLGACSGVSIHKQTLTIIANSYEGEYTGKKQKVSGFEKDSERGIKASDKRGVIYYITGVTSEYEGKDVKDSKEKIKVKGTPVVKNKDGKDFTDKFDVEIIEGSFKITPTEVYLQSTNISKTYDGKPLTNGKKKLLKERGWKNKDGATYKFTGSQTKIGKSRNSFEVIPKKGTDLDNYKIKKVEGTLKVEKKKVKTKVTINAKSLEVTYDGKEHKVSGFENQGSDGRIVIKKGDKKYYVSGITSKAKGTDVKDSVDKISIKGSVMVEDEEGEDVTDKFTIKINKGSLKIKKRKVTLSSENLSKVYDGTPLTNGDHKIKEDGWIGSQGATYKFTGKQTEVGSSPNAFSYSLKSNTKEGNYNITKNEGTLTVKEASRISLTVKGNSYHGTYDGAYHSVSGFQNEDGSGQIVVNSNGKTYYVVGLTSAWSGKNVADSTSSIPVGGGATVYSASGKDVTSRCDITIVPGKFIIDKASVTLESKTIKRTYDGSVLENGEEELETEEGWIDGEGVDYTFISQLTSKGSIDNEFEIEAWEGTDLDNYDIETIFGQLIFK